MEISKMQELLELCARVTRETDSDAFFHYSKFCVCISIYERGFSENEKMEDFSVYTEFEIEDVYESAKREANGHIDMLSNMSNSGESVLDDASYTELEKYFDVNAVYAPDGRALSGNEVLRKYGVTSASSGEIAKNSDTDGLAAIIMDQLDNQKKSPRDEFYDELSPYVTETENARLLSMSNLAAAVGSTGLWEAGCDLIICGSRARQANGSETQKRHSAECLFLC